MNEPVEDMKKPKKRPKRLTAQEKYYFYAAGVDLFKKPKKSKKV